MALNVAQKLLRHHGVEGVGDGDAEVAIHVDQTLTQDATGTLVMLELEALELDRVRTDLSAQYVDHNLIQSDHRNADDHAFLRSACRRFGVWFSPPGNGVSHPVHMDVFGRPGASLLGSDSHTCAAGALGMLALGTGGLEVALAMTGEPYRFPRPSVLGVRLTGRLPDWVSAKDVVLEMLRRHGVSGGVGRILEYRGPGLSELTALDRHVVANMGAELGATTTVFPSDREVRRFLASRAREEDWRELVADEGATYDEEDEIDLSSLEPLIALPSSPGNVVPVRDVAGREIQQAYLGSSANPGFRDFAIGAAIVAGKRVDEAVSFDVNPTTRALLEDLVASGRLGQLIAAGARLHQTGCNGCIGMGQAPATGGVSLRTVPRNFPGRSGSRADRVYLCSPETAAASALTGRITDPRELDLEPPRPSEPARESRRDAHLVPPVGEDQACRVLLVKGPSVGELPDLARPRSGGRVPVLLVLGDDVSTDEILPAGARVLPFRSNVERVAEFCFEAVDGDYVRRAREVRDYGGHAIVAGLNYGQGSSREHAALAPRTLGLRAVLARGFARIHRQNLVNFGVLPLLLVEEGGRAAPARGDVLVLPSPDELPAAGEAFELAPADDGDPVRVRHDLSARELEVLRAGGGIGLRRRRMKEASA